MEKISFQLEVFEGPLDLLLSLISKHKLNIYDIEISRLLEQYLAYLDSAGNRIWSLPANFWRWQHGSSILRRQPFCRGRRKRIGKNRRCRGH